MNYIINNSAIIFFLAKGPLKIEKTSVLFPKVMKLFDLPSSEQEQALLDIVEVRNPFEKEGVSVNISTGEVAYKGELLPKVLGDKIVALAKEGLPITLFEKFWENLRKNPSTASVKELYDFLAVKELPITEDGCFLAYRGLRADYYSKNGNKSTKVLKGKVDEKGRIYNGIGEEIEVERNQVDDDRNQGCSFGLHVGSLSYAKGWSGGQLVVVKVNPKDVVSVPKDCSCQKCRVCAYVVLQDFKQEIVAPATTRQGKPVVSQDRKELSAFTQRVKRYLDNKKKKKNSTVSVKAIQNSFSPEYPSKEKVLNALGELGKTWKGDVVRL